MKRGAETLRWLAAASLTGMLAGLGCASSPEPQFYALFPDHGSALTSRSLEIELRRPGLPGYLDRPQIVRQQQPGKLEFSGADRWGAPLEDMVGGILAQDLAQRLPSARVYTEAGAISSAPDAQVEIEIERFELTERGAVELVAQVALHWPRAAAADRIERYTLSRAPKNASTVELVAQMSGLLAELANSIARALVENMPEDLPTTPGAEAAPMEAAPVEASPAQPPASP